MKTVIIVRNRSILTWICETTGQSLNHPERVVSLLPFQQRCTQWTTCQLDMNTVLILAELQELDTTESPPVKWICTFTRIFEVSVIHNLSWHSNFFDKLRVVHQIFVPVRWTVNSTTVLIRLINHILCGNEEASWLYGSTGHAAPSLFSLFQKHCPITARPLQFLFSNGSKQSVKSSEQSNLQQVGRHY